MTLNKKLFIRDINMEIIVDGDDTFVASTSVDDPISQTKKYEKPEFNIGAIVM